ncbi:MAG TPA: ATP-binding protein [Longimicrobiales bacterium]|nr:ATP-binding protein [Longimicrobiales bacterium]
MSVRTRILLASVAAAAVPLLVFAIGARREVAERLGAQYQARVDGAVEVIRADLAGIAVDLDARLAALGSAIVDDAAVRAALMQEGRAGGLRDYATRVMPAAGLDYLLLLDAEATVLSSGHFRNDYGRRASALRDAGSSGPILVQARRASGRFLALARVHRFTIAGRTFLLAGGIEVDSAFVRRLARDESGTLVVTLSHPGGELASAAVSAGGGDFLEDVSTPFVDDIGTAGDSPGAREPVATWTIRHSTAPLAVIRRGMDAWLLAAIVAAVLLAILIARVLAARVNRPLEELAARARRIDLERLDTSFATRRFDEVGSLARVLDAMVQRLRASAAELRSAERRATVGDIARQVNHDIRNGLLPIRNVIHHLDEVAHESPADLSRVFAERAPTLRSGVGYLEKLATSYARLTPAASRVPVDVNDVIRSAVDSTRAVTLRLAAAPLVVSADPVSLRRVVENLVVNALDSIGNGSGTVTVTTAAEVTADGSRVVISVADTGSGIAPDDLDRIFDDFHTTRPHGTGLGLSIVRRLVNDMGGRIRVASEPGRGATFRIELPEAG